MKKIHLAALYTFILSLFLSSCSEKEEEPPNIVLILADDMGYSDIGCYGSEISTPNIDQLAEDGLRFTHFYNGARSCPTRASLISGLYAHQTGMGGMEPDRGLPGYRGNINRECVTLAEALGANGYATYMAGKWHLTNKVNVDSAQDKFNWPVQRGFDRYYGTIAGAGNFFHPHSLTRQNKVIEEEARQDSSYYYTDAISNHAVQFIQQHPEEKDSPMFLYVAYTAPHWPLQAKEKDIAKYRKMYRAGWDEIRQSRYQRMIDMGIIEPEWELPPRDARVAAWDSLEYADLPDKVAESIEDADHLRALMTEKMATYAAMVDCMDQGIGRIVEALRQKGELDNTLLVFLSDNGGCDEWGTYGFGWNNFQKTGEIAGTEASSTSYGPAWAHVSNTPFRYYKLYDHEGGTATPFVVHWPKKIKKGGQLTRQVAHIIDIMPTFLDAGQGEYPTQYKGHSITPMEGESLLPVFEGDELGNRTLYWEHIGNRAVRKDNWKLVALRNQPWELYQIDADRSELNNLAGQYPEKVDSLSAMWEQWAERVHAKPWPWDKN